MDNVDRSRDVLRKKILIFDDDALYVLTLQRQALLMDVDTTYCRTMEEFCLRALEGDFDAVLIDFHLDHFKGDVVAKVIENRPVVIMSTDEGVFQKQSLWPSKIVAFASKHWPVREVISAAVGRII